MSSDSSDDEDFNPDSIDDQIIERDFESEKQAIISNLLPQKSRATYELAYTKFLKWRHDNNAILNEDVLLVYFKELSDTWKPPTLWSIWSKLRATLSLRDNININHYNLLKTFLKNTSKGYKPKKSKVLTWAQLKQFLNTSDDHIYLAIKVIFKY